MSELTYAHLLRADEWVAMPPPVHGSQEWAYGCSFAPIENNTHEQGNSVVIDIEPGGATEPVLIEADLMLSVRVLQGSGRVVRWNAAENGGQVTSTDLVEGGDPLTLARGDAYYYLNDGFDNLILRDDSTPAFVDGDEVMLAAAPAEGRPDGREVRLPVGFWRGFIR